MTRPTGNRTTHLNSDRTIIVGLGNPIVSDDSVGICVARRLREVIKDRNDIEVVEVYAGGLRLMDALVGFRRAVIVDAMVTGAAPGTVRTFSIDDLPATRNIASTHDVDLPTALETGRTLGLALPVEITIIGIEAANVTDFSESLSTEVQPAVKAAVDIVLGIIGMDGAIR